jgi:hypothetical protein
MENKMKRNGNSALALPREDVTLVIPWGLAAVLPIPHFST